MRYLLAALSALFLLSCQPQQGAGVPGCTVSSVTDGDTLRLTCEGRAHRVRLLGIDTPELFHPSCPAEYHKARAAQQAMQALALTGEVTAVRFQGTDRYGRALARVSVAGRDLSQAMLDLGLAQPYSGHRHPDWCGAPGA